MIPVSFEYKGKAYQGIFTAPHGAGGNTWFLMINNYFYGQLIYSREYGFRFASHSGMFEELSEEFGDHITTYYG